MLVRLDRGIQLNPPILLLRFCFGQACALQRLPGLRGKVLQQAALRRGQRDRAAPDLDGPHQAPIIQDRDDPVSRAIEQLLLSGVDLVQVQLIPRRRLGNRRLVP